jgi:hypothetical protein
MPTALAEKPWGVPANPSTPLWILPLDISDLGKVVSISSAMEPSRPRKARTCAIVKKMKIHVKEVRRVIKFVQIHLKGEAHDQPT